jgi:Ca-activated chloride channel family protein
MERSKFPTLPVLKMKENCAVSSSLAIQVTLSHPYVPPTVYLEEPLYAVMEISPSATDTTRRAPLNIVLVVDASATMHHFQLTDDERDYWLGLAISRDEMERGQADEQDAIYWTGQTLAEMQTVARKPMAIAVEAIKNLLTTLQPTDKVTVIAFADRVHTVFTAHDWSNYSDQSILQLDALREQRLPVDIGTGTYMAEALRAASDALKQNAENTHVNRLIVISDGIVQDADTTLAGVAAIQDEGLAITTIGIGDDFDEEFLTRIADNSRGQYYYAADIEEITDRLHQEMATLETMSVTDLYIAVRGVGGSVVQDIFQIRPSMALFDELYTEEDWLRTRIGDVSSASPASILIQIAPTTLTEGKQEIAEAQLTWGHTVGSLDGGAGTEKTIITVDVTSDQGLLARTNPEAQGLVDRFSIYKYEREAQRAQQRADLERAKERLGAATRELHKIGEEALAQDMQEQITALGRASSDPSRVKRIKATTRRLATPPADSTTQE